MGEVYRGGTRLGDLRISQEQVGLRRDLGMVREFATNIIRL